MPSGRQIKVERLLRDEISGMIRKELKDPRVSFATVTDVKVTADLREAKVYVSTVRGPEEALKMLEGLRSAQGWILGQLIRRLDMKHVPQVRFELDPSFDHAQYIEQLIKQVKEEDSTEPDSRPADDAPE